MRIFTVLFNRSSYAIRIATYRIILLAFLLAGNGLCISTRLAGGAAGGDAEGRRGGTGTGAVGVVGAQSASLQAELATEKANKRVRQQQETMMKKMLKDFAEENNNKRARVASDDTAQTAVMIRRRLRRSRRNWRRRLCRCGSNWGR